MEGPDNIVRLRENQGEHKELGPENFQAITVWLKYLDALVNKTEASADMLGQAVVNAYEANIAAIQPNQQNEFPIPREAMRSVTSIVDEWHNQELIKFKIEKQPEIFGLRINIKNIGQELQKTGLFSLAELADLIGFYLHDSQHLSEDLHFGESVYCGKKETSSEEPNEKITYLASPERFSIFESEVKNFAMLAKFSSFSQHFLKAVIIKRLLSVADLDSLPSNLQTLARDLEEMTADVAQEIIYPIALNISRRCYGKMVLPVYLNPEIKPEGDGIVIRCPDKSIKVEINPAILTSIIYNLVKNSQKAMAEMRHKNPENTTTCQISIELSEDGTGWNFIVTDTGTGINTDKVLQIAGNLVKNSRPEQLEKYKVLMGEEVYKALEDWVSQKDRFATRQLKLGTVWDLTKLPRLSGFGETSGFSSGTGLYSADYLVRDYGGEVVGANLHPAGAIFLIHLPKRNIEKTGQLLAA